MAECGAKLIRAKSIKRSYCLELRLLRDKETRGVHECTLKGLEAQCAALAKDIDWIHERLDRNRLLTLASAQLNDDDGYARNGNYLDSANQIQDQTQDALSRTMNLVEASKEVGHTALNEYLVAALLSLGVEMSDFTPLGSSANKSR